MTKAKAVDAVNPTASEEGREEHEQNVSLLAPDPKDAPRRRLDLEG